MPVPCAITRLYYVWEEIPRDCLPIVYLVCVFAVLLSIWMADVCGPASSSVLVQLSKDNHILRQC